MHNSTLYDVAIAGGGLAGLTAAIQFADAGYNVILIEKEQYPYHKVCGEYISHESSPFLQRLGLPLADMQLPQIKRLQVSDASGRVYKFNLPLGGFGISRYTLDNLLYNTATQKGVTVITQTKINDIVFANGCFTVTTTNGNFTAKCAIGSFGKRSNIDVKWKRPFIAAKASRLNNYIGVKYHIKYPHEEGLIALHNFTDGYCGISNIEENKTCLCYLTTASNLRQNGNSIKQMEAAVLHKNPQLKNIFQHAEFLYKEPLTISQVSFSKKSQVENHVLMAGDAAGMIPPLCGNGMSMAMHAGMLAYNNTHLYLQHKITRNEMEQRYTTEWKNLFSKRLFTGRIVQSIFGGDTTTALFLKAVEKNAWLAQKLISSTHGTSF
jgi:flavin-dependent dehydrogenase